MSYTQNVKNEIMKKLNESPEELTMELFSILESRSAFEDKQVKLKVESRELADLVYKLTKKLLDIQVRTKFSTNKRFGEHHVYTIEFPIQREVNEVFNNYKEFFEGDLIKNEKLFNAYIRGIFLACGYVKDPSKEYAVDFFIENDRASQIFYELLIKSGRKAHITKKRKQNLVYLRNAEDVMDILANSGAIQEFFKFEEVTMFKEIKNKTIREMNWEVANEMKSINAGMRQLEMIEFIEKEIGLEELSPVLIEVINERKNNPEASLGELAELIGISKSGIKNRFRRIEAFYKSYYDNV